MCEVIETKYGNVKLTSQGSVELDVGVWNNSSMIVYTVIIFSAASLLHYALD